MSDVAQQQAWIYSALGNDPDLVELVEMFVDELPDRLASLREHWEARRWQELTRVAHQLKGAAGSYGFPQLTRPLQMLEQQARNEEPAAGDALDEVVELCLRIRAGAPDR